MWNQEWFQCGIEGKLSTVYQDVTIAAGTTVTLSGYAAGIHTAGLSCSPKVSLVFRSASVPYWAKRCGRNQGCGCHEWSACPVHDHGQSADGNRQSKGTNNHHLQYHEDGCLLLKDSICFSKGGESDIPFASDVKDNNETETALRAAVSPNPAINYFNLDIRSDDHVAPVTVRVLNSFGAAVFNKQAQPNTTMRIDLLTWKSGVYFVEVTQGGKRRVEKKTGQSNQLKPKSGGCDEQPPLTFETNFLYIR